MHAGAPTRPSCVSPTLERRRTAAPDIHAEAMPPETRNVGLPKPHLRVVVADPRRSIAA